ncbi:MAG: endonuclease/exonuclease/phosphatase family protein [Puniceicoccales bacterium]|nr:endonuclease/exonuclease/phosphatase family protein [Puniceicoccales bacterium]
MLPPRIPIFRTTLACVTALLGVLTMRLACAAADFKVLQINVWMNASHAPKAAENLTELIAGTNPDAVLLCELARDGKLIRRLVDDLAKRGMQYHPDGLGMRTGVLSKVPLKNPGTKDASTLGPVTRAEISFNGRDIVIYSAHLDAGHYAPYLPRGYDAKHWKKKLPAPVTDPAEILKTNRRSTRAKTITNLIPQMRRERDNGKIVILGGDFNEPSHLDWQADTRNLHGHAGAIVNWDVSQMLQRAGFIDTYREKFPNPVTHPGFTWTTVAHQSVAKEGDERDRIDFIYYAPANGVVLRSARIVGPVETVLRGKAVPDNSQDAILRHPLKTWPSDHKATLAVFDILEPGKTATLPQKTD